MVDKSHWSDPGKLNLPKRTKEIRDSLFFIAKMESTSVCGWACKKEKEEEKDESIIQEARMFSSNCYFLFPTHMHSNHSSWKQ